MPSVTVENYLKQLYVRQAAVGAPVAMGKLAAAMGVVPGTVTSMVKVLAESGLVAYEPRTGVRLTRAGEQLALRVLRRHRLIELFLVEILGLDWSEVHDEAEELEHALSDKVLERIDALLGHPSVDPHGDPIPPARGRPRRISHPTLAASTAGKRYRVARLLDQESRFLQFVQRRGLTPGAVVVVIERDASGDSVRLRPRGKAAVTLGNTAAAKILVEPLE
jgi:DtxR family Mn-dependent transcriptional regulator